MDREGSLGGISNDEEELLKRRRNDAQEKMPERRAFRQGKEELEPGTARPIAPACLNPPQ